MRNRRFVDARMLQLAEGAQRGSARLPFVAVDRPQHGIMEFGARLGGRRDARVEIAVDGFSECRGGSGIEVFEPVDGAGGCGVLRSLRLRHGLWPGLKMGGQHAGACASLQPQIPAGFPQPTLKKEKQAQNFVFRTLKKPKGKCPWAGAVSAGLEIEQAQGLRE